MRRGGGTALALSNMKTIVSDVESLIDALRKSQPCHVGIDGVDGVGKSQISSLVASAICEPVIELDEYLVKDRGGYSDFINYGSLAARIAEISCFVMEGVCLLEILDRLNVRLDCLIYIKRMSSGLWSDERECEFPSGIEAAIRQSRRDAELMLEFEARQEGRPYISASTDEPRLSEEIMHYHAKHTPHLLADITFCNHVG